MATAPLIIKDQAMEDFNRTWQEKQLQHLLDPESPKPDWMEHFTKHFGGAFNDITLPPKLAEVVQIHGTATGRIYNPQQDLYRTAQEQIQTIKTPKA